MVVFSSFPIFAPCSFDMNWTGGSLQRHSKANANVLAKRQKQHFANVRLRSHLQSRHQPFLPSPSILSIPAGLERESPSRKRRSSQINPQGQDRLCPSHYKIRRVLANVRSVPENNKLGQEAVGVGKYRQDIYRCWGHLFANAVLSRGENANSVDYARRHLLQKSDWVGLSITRPARLRQSGRHDMDELDRQRKVSLVKDKRARSQNARRRRAERTMRPAPARKVDLSSLLTEDISLRGGSNMHHTQTTPSIFARVGSTYTSPGALVGSTSATACQDEPMTVESSSDTPASFDRESSLEERTANVKAVIEAERASAEELSLISLEKARGLQLTSWDMIRAHAAKLGGSTSCPPSDPMLLPASNRRTDEQAAIDLSRQHNPLAPIASHPQYLTHASSPMQPSSMQRGHPLGTIADAGSFSLSPPHFQPQVSPGNQVYGNLRTHNIMQSPHLVSQAANIHAGTDRSPRFTIEEQVDQERRQGVRGLSIDISSTQQSHSLAFDTVQPPFGYEPFRANSESVLPSYDFTPSDTSKNHEWSGPYERFMLTPGGNPGAQSSFPPQRPDSVDRLAIHRLVDESAGRSVHPQRTHPENFLPMLPPSHDGHSRARTLDTLDNVASYSARNTGIAREPWMQTPWGDNAPLMHGWSPPDIVHADPANCPTTSPTYHMSSSPSLGKNVEDSQRYSSLFAGASWPPRPIPAAPNTYQCVPLPQSDMPPQTRWGTRLGSTEGRNGDNMADMSVYNNAPRTDRSFWTSPGGISQTPRSSKDLFKKPMPKPRVAGKRKAEDLERPREAIQRPRHAHGSAHHHKSSSMQPPNSTNASRMRPSNSANSTSMPPPNSMNATSMHSPNSMSMPLPINTNAARGNTAPKLIRSPSLPFCPINSNATRDNTAPKLIRSPSLPFCPISPFSVSKFPRNKRPIRKTEIQKLFESVVNEAKSPTTSRVPGERPTGERSETNLGGVSTSPVDTDLPPEGSPPWVRGPFRGTLSTRPPKTDWERLPLFSSASHLPGSSGSNNATSGNPRESLPPLSKVPLEGPVELSVWGDA